MVRRRNISKQTRTVLSVLLLSPKTWRYGYEITKITNLKSGALYPILMRLSDQGYLESDWRESERPGRPPRHIYRLSPSGLALARKQSEDKSLAPISLQIGLSA